MVAREEGADPVNIAQVFQRGGYLQVGWADSGIKTIDDLRGTKVGSWGFGNELILYAALRGAGIEPNVDAEIVQQPFDTSLLLRREVDTIQAKTYNEYAQLLEATNPDTGELYQPEDFVAINLNELGYDSLEDGIYAQADWLADGDNADIAERFLEASFKGWASCRDDFEGCVNIVLDAGTTLGQGHMTWMLNEINKLIWPSPAGIGMMDADAWDRTVKVGLDGGDHHRRTVRRRLPHRPRPGGGRRLHRRRCGRERHRLRPDGCAGDPRRRVTPPPPSGHPASQRRSGHPRSRYRERG